MLIILYINAKCTLVAPCWIEPRTQVYLRNLGQCLAGQRSSVQENEGCICPRPGASAPQTWTYC